MADVGQVERVVIVATLIGEFVSKNEKGEGAERPCRRCNERVANRGEINGASMPKRFSAFISGLRQCLRQ